MLICCRISLGNYTYARLCNLRRDMSAQKEIREYAEAVVTLLEPKFPVSWVALCKTD